MAAKRFYWEKGKNAVSAVHNGKVVAVIRYSLDKIYQVELSKEIPRRLEFQVLRDVYLYSNECRGEKNLSLSEVRALSQHELRDKLRQRDIDVARLAYQDLTEALAVVLRGVACKYLAVQVVPHEFSYRDHVHLFFTLHSKHDFIIWKSEWIPNPETDNIHIVPDYHPCMNGKKSIHMINGDTDHRVRGYSIVRVESPVEARAKMGDEGSPSTWTHLKHPYYAKGSSISLSVRSGLLCTDDGVQELTRFLKAALGKTDEYVEVSGGFRAPLYHAHNLLIDMGIPSPSKRLHFGHTTRGSEESCVWQYRTLLAEGKLEGAYVPEWFINEGWLGIYEGTEQRPGLY